MKRKFSDHFSPVAPRYAAFRPGYPDALFEWLAGLAPSRALAWDCATGNGQAAEGLARHFERVVATDASAAQIAAAAPNPRIYYRVAAAEESGLPPSSADLVTVAQALHWFDLQRFYGEVERVLVPGGVLAAWTYGMLETGDAKIDALLDEFYTATLGPFWPPERRHVETGYRTLPFPYPELPAAQFSMERRWTLEELLGFLRTWSATVRFTEINRLDPVEPLGKKIAPLWEGARMIRWPLAIRAGHKERPHA